MQLSIYLCTFSSTCFGLTRPFSGAMDVNLLNAELNPICHLLALLEAHNILHVSRIRVKFLYIYSLCCPVSKL